MSTRNLIPMVEEAEAAAEVGQIYREIKQLLQIPFVPNSLKTLAVSPAVLKIYWGMYRSFFQHATLPHALVSMILYTVAQRNDCMYCSANNELTCRTLGVDEETLKALSSDLGNIAPERLQAIIEFAAKAAKEPHSLGAQDYEKVRDHGLSDAELVEVLLVAAIGNLNDTLADSLKFEVEAPVAQALGRRVSERDSSPQLGKR
jgi:uncharacterized peroxidase-related enzyme